MKNMKQILAAVLVMVLVAAASIGVTVAFLTDQDSETNIFTLGNVDIALHEDFEQGSMLMPGKEIVKKPTIENTGINDAWVWATVAIPAELDDPDDASKNIIHFNYSAESVAAGLWTWTDASGNWLVEENVDINGIAYNVYTVMYQTALKPGDTTEHPVIHRVYMDPHVDIDANGNMFWVSDGISTAINWNAKSQTPTIHVAAYAIQKEGFNNVWDAYAAYQDQWN